MPETRRLFCFGLGYAVLALARRALAQGWRVAGTRRSREGAVALRALGIEGHVFDRGCPLDDVAAALFGTTHLLSSVPPDESGDAVLDHHGSDIGALSGLRWAGYLSTTGVYGNRDGGEVDEDAALRPSSPRSRRRVEAERGWLALQRERGVPVHIFRLAGIYGPGRSALDRLVQGTARRIAKPGQIFSRIHVDDIAAVLEASMARPRPGRVYNVADDAPAPPDEVIVHAAKLLGIAPPPAIPFEEAELSDMAKSFYLDSKRVSNARIKAELGVTLAYPSYREGLAAILAAERGTPMTVETICTIGYEGAAVESLIAALKRAGVEMLLDVRAVAVSRRKAFGKEALRQSLEAAGIVYRHLPALGTPAEGRAAAKGGDRKTFEAILAAQLDSPAGQRALDEAASSARREQVALMCLERDPAHCHRTIVAARIAARTGQRVEALYADPLL